jgi:hypothetical protein
MNEWIPLMILPDLFGIKNFFAKAMVTFHVPSRLFLTTASIPSTSLILQSLVSFVEVKSLICSILSTFWSDSFSRRRILSTCIVYENIYFVILLIYKLNKLLHTLNISDVTFLIGNLYSCCTNTKARIECVEYLILKAIQLICEATLLSFHLLLL